MAKMKVPKTFFHWNINMRKMCFLQFDIWVKQFEPSLGVKQLKQSNLLIWWCFQIGLARILHQSRNLPSMHWMIATIEDTTTPSCYTFQQQVNSFALLSIASDGLRFLVLCQGWGTWVGIWRCKILLREFTWNVLLQKNWTL